MATPKHAPPPPPPMPQWIKSMFVPATTKQYFYEEWLAGNIADAPAPVDWGLFTDIADVVRHLTVNKPKSRSDIFPKQSLEELQQIGSEIAQRRTELRLAISATDGIDVAFEDEVLTLNEAIIQEQNLAIFAGRYKKAISRRRPSTETTKDPDANLQVALETAEANSNEAYATMLQEITSHPGDTKTVQPYRDRYFAALKILDKAETNSLNSGQVVPKTVTATMGLLTRDLTVQPSAQVKPVVATGDFGPQISETRPQAVGEDRVEQARFARIKTGELKPGTALLPIVGEETLVDDTGPGGDGSAGGGGSKDLKKTTFTKQDVNDQLTSMGLPDTPENRKTAREAIKQAGGVKPRDNAWEAIFRQNYPQYSWMFTDLDRTKYGDVFDLFFKAKDGKMLNAEFDRRFQGTSWYTGLVSSKKARELSAAIGTFNWGSGNLAKFLAKAINYGYEGENLKQQAYTELFAKVGDKYVNDLAVKEVRASSPFLALKRIGTQFLTPLGDQTVEDALTGGRTADDLLRTSREQAKAMYPHLAASIDAGVTLEELSEGYKRIAAQTLELDPSQVDMGLKFNEALKYTKDGGSRMLSYGEWETMLRTDDKFKYAFTKQANQDATDIGLSIARAFGKVS